MFNALSAGIVVGIMVVPLIASLSEDAMNAVPNELRYGAYALGSTKFEVATRVVTPAALSGIVASFILAISRAIGETMAVVLAAGMTPNLTFDPRESIQTLTSYIVQVSLGDTPFGSVEYQSIFAVGLLLFAVTLVMNIFGLLVPEAVPRGVLMSVESRSLEAPQALVARRRRGKVFQGLCLAATLVGVVTLVVLLADVLVDGVKWLTPTFFTEFPSRIPARAGIKSALYGTVWLMGLVAVVSFPLGVAAAVWLEEYAKRGWLQTAIQTNIANLAGVPSIVYGILGLAVFVRWMVGFTGGRSVISGALTISLLVLPTLIIAGQEAIRAVPNSIREASYGLGATKWQTVRHHVLPNAMPGIMTGTILALSRAIGETAPLIMIGALTFIAFVPDGPTDQFTVLSIQVYNWVSRPQDDFRGLAAAAIIVLLVLLLSMNALAIWLRNRYRKEW